MPPVAFEAIKMRWSQDKEGFVLTLRVNPSDVRQDVAMAPIGQQWVVAVEPCEKLTDETSPGNGPPRLPAGETSGGAGKPEAP